MSQTGLSGIRFWIVSAWWPEQREFAEEMAGSSEIISVNENISICGSLGFLRTGVGTPRAAAAVAHALALGKSHGSFVDAVLFLATAGAYAEQLPLGSAYLVSNVSWSDGDLLEKKSYLPGLKSGTEQLSCDLAPFSGSELTAISTPGISLDLELSKKLAKHGDLENLELYGVALASEAFGVPWGASLGVSNVVGPDAHEQWRGNHLIASKAAQTILYDQFLRKNL